jgi:Protein of unknown function with HXXEE motif
MSHSNSSNFKMLFWLPSLTFILHTLEELPEFPIWVSKHFSSMSVVEFSVIHIPLIWFVIWVSYRATATSSMPAWRFWACAAQWQFAFNAIFHLGSSAAFSDYSPGMVTAATVALPATIFMTVRCHRLGLMPKDQALKAACVGGIIAIIAVGTLFV